MLLLSLFLLHPPSAPFHCSVLPDAQWFQPADIDGDLYKAGILLTGGFGKGVSIERVKFLAAPFSTESSMRVNLLHLPVGAIFFPNRLPEARDLELPSFVNMASPRSTI